MRDTEVGDRQLTSAAVEEQKSPSNQSYRRRNEEELLKSLGAVNLV